MTAMPPAHVCLIREDNGFYSAVVANLPGCGSCGASEEEAVVNVQEAIRGTIQSYIADGKDIPWNMAEEIPEGTVRSKRITVTS